MIGYVATSGLLMPGLLGVGKKFITDWTASSLTNTNMFSGIEEYALAFVMSGLTSNLDPGSKVAIDIFLRPAMSQFVGGFINDKSFDPNKYIYDVVTRAITRPFGFYAPFLRGIAKIIYNGLDFEPIPDDYWGLIPRYDYSI